MDKDCVFCKIVGGEIPCQKVYEDEDFLAFNDINPAAPIHILVIPKEHHSTLSALPSDKDALLLKLLKTVSKIAADKSLDKTGFRTVINTGKDAGQEVFHIHVHILGGTRLGKMA
ncbi:MAG: histidine triad nucleotide-binding protein [Pseudomonadota bacterium]